MKIMKILIFSLFLQLNLFGEVSEVEKIQLKTQKGLKSLRIEFSSNYMEFPSLRFDRNQVDLIIPKAKIKYQVNNVYNLVNSKVKSKKFKVRSRKNLDQTILSLIFGTKTKIKNDDIQVSLKDNSIDLVFAPKFIKKVTSFNPNPNPEAIDRNKKIATQQKPQKVMPAADEKLDEKFLNSLMAENTKLTKKTDKIQDKKSSFLKTDKSSSNFSINKYIGKIVAFIGIILVLFYGLILLFKKGFIKKSKMSFLKNGASIQILNTTYISPKKSLMLVRVNQQIFLVGSSDQGMNLISEIDDSVSTLKETEKEIIGSNFDDKIEEKSKKDKEFKLKEDIYQSHEGALKEFLKNKEVSPKSNNQNMESIQLSSKSKKSFAKGFKEKLSQLKPINEAR